LKPSRRRHASDAPAGNGEQKEVLVPVSIASIEEANMSLTMGTGPFGHEPSGVSNLDLRPREWQYLEPSPRRIRGVVGDVVVVDSGQPMLFFEHGQLPRYYFPRADVRADLLPNGHTKFTEGKGTAQFFDLVIGDRRIKRAGWTYQADGDPVPDLRPYVAFYWRVMDRWLEEDMEALAHARDPYHRVDAVPSSRHVRVLLDGEVLAETNRPVAIFETGLPARWYMPREDVRADLEPTDLRTVCAYKGYASYYSVRTAAGVRENLVWTYREPRRDAAPVQDLLAFFNEQTDIEVDGVVQPRPGGPWAEPNWWRGAAVAFERQL
jgi:uncharacterized protein (DUF427 family)